ncbi:MAG: DEAD/DEAH box helicase family protein, partial [Desulfobacterales bacterium]|nr:DEAD/DEAH box helicase family protein [Desulfobacterales bacterium]
MLELNKQFISRNVASSKVIFQRGERIYEYGGFMCVESDPEKGLFVYDVDGNYGDYTTRVQFLDNDVNYSCDCPFPGKGCKHTVAVMLDVHDRMAVWRVDKAAEAGAPPMDAGVKDAGVKYLGVEEVRARALEDRENRAKSEELHVIPGDMYKGEHVVETPKGRRYKVTLHDPANGRGHCSCPDFGTNRLGVCKHLVFLSDHFKRKRGFKTRVARERFPFVDIFWDSVHERPRLFNERTNRELGGVRKLLDEYFDDQGLFIHEPSTAFPTFFARIEGRKQIRVQERVPRRISDLSSARELEKMAKDGTPALSMLKTELYPYQKEGVEFGLYRRAALIGDEMGLGKTLQAIALAILKKEIFGYDKVLVVTLASLKEQWKREIERFSGEKAMVVAGTAKKREEIYAEDDSLFKITNYEAVLRDVEIISRFKPHVVILDEAQRIKNFNTKTADAVKRLPREHALVLTGTPLENKLEDVYSIIQFLDPYMLSPLWRFAADHFMLSPTRRGKILGYRNLDLLHEKLKSIVIRRRKEEVLSDLPDEVVNNYYLDLTPEQAGIHGDLARKLMPLLNKKYLTPVD